MSENLTLTERVLKSAGGLCLGGATAGVGIGTYKIIHAMVDLFDKVNMEYGLLCGYLMAGSLTGFLTLSGAVGTAVLLYQGATGKKAKG